MTRFLYGENGQGKLVRDKLAEVIENEGHIVKTYKLDQQQVAQAIANKLPEECSEIYEALLSGNREDLIEEIADIETLIGSLCRNMGISAEEVVAARNRKIEKKGAFDHGVFIEYVELSDNGKDYDFWCQHFRKNSDRYIEE